jgi:hypothetical protein
MSTKDDGGPAFPFGTEYTRRDYFGNEEVMHENEPGMTLRDYFAAKAMQSIVAVLHQGIRPVDLEKLAKDAYAIAHEMMIAREA